MSVNDIQRYDTEDEMYPVGSSDPVHKTWREGEGLWVLHADHVEAIAAERLACIAIAESCLRATVGPADEQYNLAIEDVLFLLRKS
jgi:hypothetical protein